MTNELSKERAIEVLYTVRAYYASLTAGYPKGKDCRGIGDVMCSEIANSCLMAIKALEQPPITWIVGKDNCQVAVRNMPIDKMQKIYAIIGDEERQQQPNTGKWISIDATHSQCDKCLAVFEIVSANGEANFCPNCGADMRESEV